jgi:hypothetical protein
MPSTDYTYQSCAYNKVLGLQAACKRSFLIPLALALLVQGFLISGSSFENFGSTLQLVTLDGYPSSFERHLYKPNAVLVLFIFRGSITG